MTTEQAQSVMRDAISRGMAKIAPVLDLTTRGTPRKRLHTKLIGWTDEQKLERHRAQMRLAHRRKQMSIDSANQIINEQEDAIAELKHKILDMTDARDMALGKAIELLAALRRIECCAELGGGDLDEICQIARRAIDDYSGK